MKVKEAIHKIKSDSYFVEYSKLISIPLEKWQPYYENRYVYPYRLLYGDSDKYSKSLFEYRKDNLLKYIPNFNQKIELNLDFWGKVNAYIKIDVNEYSRTEAKVKTDLHFHFYENGNPKFLWDAKFTLPENLDLSESSLKTFLLNELSKHLYLNGLMAGIQYSFNCTKKDAMYYRKNKYSKNWIEQEGKLQTIFNIIKKRFNIDSYIDIDKTIKIVNQIGRQKVLTKIEKYNISWFFDFDGDVDELETEYFDSIENNTIYV